MSFAFHEPDSLAAAVDLGARLGPDGRYLAGGTDLIIQMRRGQVAPAHLISLTRLPGLAGIAVNGAIGVGAAVSHRAIERHPAFRGALRALPEAARVVGGHQVRNMGTIGGNVANASPAADLVPVLLVLDARAVSVTPDGPHTREVADLMLGPGRAALRPGELLTEIVIPALPPRSGTAFLKAGRRRAMEISVVCVAARVALDRTLECCTEARIALGAVAPTALRAREAEAVLIGQPAAREVFAEAARRAVSACRPIDDVRASARYRRLLVEALVARALAAAAARARELAA